MKKKNKVISNDNTITITADVEVLIRDAHGMAVLGCDYYDDDIIDSIDYDGEILWICISEDYGLYKFGKKDLKRHIEEFLLIENGKIDKRQAETLQSIVYTFLKMPRYTIE